MEFWFAFLKKCFIVQSVYFQKNRVFFEFSGGILRHFYQKKKPIRGQPPKIGGNVAGMVIHFSKKEPSNQKYTLLAASKNIWVDAFF